MGKIDPTWAFIFIKSKEPKWVQGTLHDLQILAKVLIKIYGTLRRSLCYDF